ncbi:hypothetical protein [Pectobacterium brasiliense]|uniref:hypothetical protein n=1 Tax=Pectobacterium brasiliense TaxID=180957 RepID=UPI000D42B166|nr:hypothetical protein [Pectobacterium brasiliense]PPE64194.1 hypothetical protein F152LOC_00984 [Pectobacterium brasiliense]
MAERWKIYLLILLIALSSAPITTAAVQVNVPMWAIIAGQCGLVISGFIAALLDRA